MDNLLDEGADLGLDLLMVGVVDNFPVVLLLIEYCVNSKDGHDFLRISVNVLLEVNQTVFNCSLERFGELLVQLLEEVEPLGLNVFFASEEELFVGGYELLSDNLEVVLKSLLLQLEMRLLLVHELLKFVQLTLLNVGQNGRRNNLKLVSDLGLTDLEVVYLLKHICAVAAALVHETVAGEEPVVLLHARVDYFVKSGQVVIEERFFTRVDQQ